MCGVRCRCRGHLAARAGFWGPFSKFACAEFSFHAESIHRYVRTFLIWATRLHTGLAKFVENARTGATAAIDWARGVCAVAEHCDPASGRHKDARSTTLAGPLPLLPADARSAAAPRARENAAHHESPLLCSSPPKPCPATPNLELARTCTELDWVHACGPMPPHHAGFGKPRMQGPRPATAPAHARDDPRPAHAHHAPPHPARTPNSSLSSPHHGACLSLHRGACLSLHIEAHV